MRDSGEEVSSTCRLLEPLHIHSRYGSMGQVEIRRERNQGTIEMLTSIHPTRFPLNDPDRSTYLYVSTTINTLPPSSPPQCRCCVRLPCSRRWTWTWTWTRELQSIASSIAPRSARLRARMFCFDRRRDEYQEHCDELGMSF
jgi:hypothetical protein